MTTRWIGRCVAAGFVLILASAVQPAKADIGPSDSAVLQSAVARANPHVGEDVLSELPTSLLGRSDLYIASDIRPDTVFVDENGTPIPGQTEEETAYAVAACAPKSIAAVAGSGWSPANNANCALVRSNPDVTKTYVKQQNPASSGTACWQGRRFTKTWVSNPPPLTGGYWKYTEGWVSLLCSNTNVTVSWGQVAAYPSVKIMGLSGYWYGQWS
ncbi:hypothetical protein GCM10025789_11860 [Tessaracoccus lubricantis]|uniref:Secreted protein n=1 Tax=Tessaracoccus lubricantis TaxID=545543 RepID=A0ABP9F778_9ACTN